MCRYGHIITEIWLLVDECEEQQIQVAAWDSVLLGHRLDDSSVLEDVVEGVAEPLVGWVVVVAGVPDDVDVHDG